MLDILFHYIEARLDEANTWFYHHNSPIEALLCLAELAVVLGAIGLSVFALSMFFVLFMFGS